MQIDLNELERKAKAAGCGEWQMSIDGDEIPRSVVMHGDGDILCECYSNIGHQPEAVFENDIAAYIAAANPAVILELAQQIKGLRDIEKMLMVKFELAQEREAKLQAENAELRRELEEARKRSEIFYVEKHHWHAKFEYLIRVLSRIHGFLLPNGVQLPDGRRFEFSNPDVERDMLRGLTAAIRAVPDELKKAEEQTPVDPWDAARQQQGDDAKG